MEPRIPPEVRFAKSARKHRIGTARAKFVMTNNSPLIESHPEGLELKWIGFDDRGVELEVIAIDLGNRIFVIHVMPYNFRRRGNG